MALFDVVPAPAVVEPAPGSFTLQVSARIRVSPRAEGVASYLADVLRPSTGFALPVVQLEDGDRDGDILLVLGEADPRTGRHGYELMVTGRLLVIRAEEPVGLFAGVQTLRQLLPAEVESGSPAAGMAWAVPAGRIVDFPRFGYRGAMLDVARRFFPVDEVRRFIDHLALYKVNHLHLHLTDDQGWRIAVKQWPNLTLYGGGTEVGDGSGGYYEQSDYSEIVAHAAERFITIVPEIDMPGHTNAALASYPELNEDGRAPDRYTGIEVGFSALCVTRELTYQFVDEVFEEVARLTPGPYLHMGGDEVKTLEPEAYDGFVTRVQRIIAAHGKTPMAWHEAARAAVGSSIAHYWGTAAADADVTAAVARGVRLVLCPPNRTYLDMKYDDSTVLGQRWAGVVGVRDAYDWDPGSYLSDVDSTAVLGVEAPLWSETIRSLADAEFMAFPRLPALAELGWSPASAHDWESFRQRLATHGRRWDAMGLTYFPSPEIPWR
ncbi:MAG TPA: beta-N-acetylhexosaminidase [Micromonosporaceae bacterium]|nr:beta-N-acetylhexosaminidase [Micromonosporaceae bacterium]